jgi:hypothetical protein
LPSVAQKSPTKLTANRLHERSIAVSADSVTMVR